MKSRRGPECLGVRASWPPVVALVVMNGRPAPRCKRRRYRCAAFAQPIRTSTVGFTCAYSLRVSRTPDPQDSGRPSLRVQRTDPSRRVLPLIERNILMILFRHRVPVTRGHRATVDRTVDLLLPVILAGGFFFFGAAFSCSGAVVSGAAVDAVAGAVPPLGAPCASATPAGSNTRAAADAATTRRGSFCLERSGSGQLRVRRGPITSAAARTPGFWRGGPARTGYAWPGCRS
jgi:hypothetical protein